MDKLSKTCLKRFIIASETQTPLFHTIANPKETILKLVYDIKTSENYLFFLDHPEENYGYFEYDLLALGPISEGDIY